MSKELDGALALKQPATPRQRGENTRQRLLDEAERQFAETGFRGTSLNAIAIACGVGNAGVLHHFASKEKLYKAVLQRLGDDLEADMEAIAARAGAPHERLRLALRHQAAGVAANPRRNRLILRELMDNLGRVEHAKSFPLRRWVAAFCALIEEAQAAGAAAPGSPIVLLAQYLGALSYALVVRPTFARMGMDQTLLNDEQRWLATAAAAAERALLGDESAEETAPGRRP
jgi:AcrR family transcriptional regulator